MPAEQTNLHSVSVKHLSDQQTQFSISDHSDFGAFGNVRLIQDFDGILAPFRRRDGL